MLQVELRGGSQGDDARFVDVVTYIDAYRNNREIGFAEYLQRHNEQACKHAHTEDICAKKTKEYGRNTAEVQCIQSDTCEKRMDTWKGKTMRW